MNRFILVTTGEKAESIELLESRFEQHLAPHGRFETFRLGNVSSLLTAYWKTSEMVDDPDALLLFAHQDIQPVYLPGQSGSEAEIRSVAAQAPWLASAFNRPEKWVEQLVQLSGQEDAGFFGVAGATSLHPFAAWWNEPTLSGAVLHTVNSGPIRLNAFGPYGRVAVLDGLFLAARAKVFKAMEKPQATKCFHFYDMELCLRAHLAGKKNWTLPLLLLHASGGDEHLDSEWRMAAAGFADRFEETLPLNLSTDALPDWE